MLNIIIKILQDKKKIALVVILFIFMFSGISFLISNYSGPKKESAQKEEIKNTTVFDKKAEDNIEIEYIPFAGNNKQCLLAVTNNNNFQVHVEASVSKYDENHVLDTSFPDKINCDLNPNQTHYSGASYPNNVRDSEEEENNNARKIEYKINELSISPVQGSDKTGKKSKVVLRTNEVNVSLDLSKRNNVNQPVLTIKNTSKDKLDIDGIVVFYKDDIPFETAVFRPAAVEKGTSNIYLSLYMNEKLDYSNYQIYLNDVK